MTDSDLARIETALGIVLPDAYRKLFVPFAVPAYVGNSETELWDDADGLIALNSELRAGSAFVTAWPAHMFATGRDGSGCASALDLSNPAGPVWWADRCHLDTAGSGPSTQSLDEWAKQYVADLRSDLEGDGIDRDGSPEGRQQTGDESARAGCQFFVVLVGAGVLVVLVVWGLVKLLIQ